MARGEEQQAAPRPCCLSGFEIRPEDLHDVELEESSEVAPARPSRPSCFISMWHECLFVAVVAFSASSFVFLQRAIVVITASIKPSLSMSQPELSWIMASSGLTTGAFLLPLGVVGDRCRWISRKAYLLSSLVLFCLLVGLSAISENGICLDIFSALTGVACAAHIPSALGLLTSAYPIPSRRKNLVFAFFLAGSNPSASLIGGVGSGLVSSKFDWRASFVFLALLFALVALLGLWVVPDLRREREATDTADKETEDATTKRLASRIFHEFDTIGVVLLLSAITLISTSLTLQPASLARWKTYPVLITLILGLLCLSCFAAWEKVTRRPLIPLALLNNWNLNLAYVSSALGSMTYYSNLFWLAFFMQSVQKLSSLQVAIQFIPQACVGLLISPLIGTIIHGINNTAILVAAEALHMGSSILLILLRRDSNYYMMLFPSLILSTLARDWSNNVTAQLIFSSVPAQHHSIGAAVFQTISRLAIPLGLSITTAIWRAFPVPINAPEAPYTKIFTATAVLAGLALLISLFIRIGKPGIPQNRYSLDNMHEYDPRSVKDWIDRHASQAPPYTDQDPKRRTGCNDSGCPANHHHRRNSSLLAKFQRKYSTQHTTSPRTTTPARPSSQALPARRRAEGGDEGPRPFSVTDKVVWLVCEDCGASKRIIDPIGDPERYFDDCKCPSHNRRNLNVSSDTTVRRHPVTSSFYTDGPIR